MVLALALALLQEPPKPDPTSGGVNEVRVTQAIDRGIKYLRGAASPDLHNAYGNSDELILWTFIHAGVPETDPQFQQLFKSVFAAPMKRTYKVSLQAMILEELDRVKYQERIAQCAQFLVDNQCPGGLWGYGNEVESALKPIAVSEPAPKPAATPGSKPPPKPKAPKKIAIKKTKDGADPGDNSNSQYAALGLRACHDAGIDLPDATIAAAIKAWKDAQFTEADRNKGKDGKGAVASSGRRVEGWNYKSAAQDQRAPYHAMTAGAVGSLVIYAYIQKRSWKNDATIMTGMNWLVDKWEMQAWNAYYMYALERFGILYGTETIGTHHWYREGAYAILGIQQSDGSWSKDEEGVGGSMWYGKTWDTCFSILFLRRATRPLVATSVMK